jgi:hypothetical protein
MNSLNKAEVACAAWIVARAAFYSGSRDSMLVFSAADRLLLEAVAEGWSPSPASLAAAFESLRESLRALPYAHRH